MKIAIVIGHNARQPGAVRATDDVSEFVWNGALASTIRDMAPAFVKVFTRVYTPSGYKAEIRAVYAQVDDWGANVSAELHFNGNDDPTATGTETLFASEAGRAVAAQVNAHMVAALGLRDRGIKKVARADRGGESLYTGRCPAVLVEPYFGSNPDDCARADDRFHALARAILTGLGAPVSAPVAAVSPPAAPTPPHDALARVAALEARVARLEAQAGP